MSQVAQQDHLYIEVADLSNVTDAEKAQVLSAWKRNVLDDVVFVTPTGHYPVVAWYIDDADAPAELAVNTIYGGAIGEMNIAL